ncbi:MAG: T9SS type A sorting domain-containing protein, partial [Bacteroidales bacterium]|nr:T9SS type A sorting domain-containing protein [Bacteroidales bacterium]
TAYAVSGDYTYSHLDNNGCTQVDTLHLTINNPVHTATTEAACETYTWNGTAYTVSGDYTYSYLDNNGCTQVDTLHLTINNPVHTATTEAACETYTWNGTAYTVSGDYTYVHADNSGCTQVDTLHLTINNPVHTATTEAACETYTWNGTAYTVSGDYTYVHTDNNGCTQVDTLHLTVNHSTTGDTAAVACDSFIWWNTNYTNSTNEATHTLTNAAGCDSVVTLHLTINHSTTGVDVQTACDSYTWIDGNTYTESNFNSQFSILNSLGCDSTVTLNLTINHSVTFYDTLTIGSNELPYDYYGNSIDGQGNLTFEGTTSEGCDSTTHLFVIVNQVGIGDVQTADGITLFPNPTSGMLTIRGNGLKRVEVMDMVGRAMLIVECQRDSERVDLSELPQGTYVVRIIAENGIAVRRVVKR